MRQLAEGRRRERRQAASGGRRSAPASGPSCQETLAMPTLVRAAALTNFIPLARHLNLNPQAELAEVGLNNKMLEDPDHSIPLRAAVQALENAAARSGCGTFGLRMAEARQVSDLGALALLLAYQATLRSALQTMVRYRHQINRALAICVEDTGGMVIIRQELVADTPLPCRQATELALGVMANLCASLLGPAWRPVGISFTHQAPDDTGRHQRLFGCQVHFGAAFNGIVCPAALLDLPLPGADPAMARYAQRFVDSLQAPGEASLAYEVRKTIYLLLPPGRATIEQIAQALGMSVRTLQRRLGDEQANFSDLINDVRRDLVRRYMNNPGYSLARIGDLLGYSLLSSFTRWFTSQFGATPAVWRAAHGKPYMTP